MHYNPPYREARLKLQLAAARSAGLGSNPSNNELRVDEIAPVDGWQLYELLVDDDAERLPYVEYLARRGPRVVRLHTSTTSFFPTNERFHWIVAEGFPQRRTFCGTLVPLTDQYIDRRIAEKRLSTIRNPRSSNFYVRQS